MSFAYPQVLLGLALLPLLLWHYLRRGKAVGIAYPSLGGLDALGLTWQRHLVHLPFALRCLVLLCLLLAVARPQVVERHEKKSADGLDILLTIDTSGSMQEEISYQRQWVPRLAAAKAVVSDFIKKRVDDRMGLVVFGENAFTQAPLTLDHQVLTQFVDNIYLGMAGDGTAIGAAIITSVKRMKDLESKSKIVILLTDGSETVGRVTPEAAAKAAQQLGVKIYTIGIGDRRSRSLDEETLASIASITGGQYFNAPSVESLIQVYDTINQLEKSRVEVKDFSRRHERFLFFLLPAIFLFILDLLYRMSSWRVLR